MEIIINPFSNDKREIYLLLQFIRQNNPTEFDSCVNDMNNQFGSISAVEDVKQTMNHETDNSKLIEYIRKNKELKQQNEQLKKELQEKESRFDDNNVEPNSKTTVEIERLNTKISETEDLLKLAQEDINSKDKKLKERDDEYRKLQRESNNEILNLNKIIRELKKRLDAYEPVTGGKIGEEKYFNVEGNALIETKTFDAPYKGVVTNNNEFRFQFNHEKGPSKDACQNKGTMLEPFCEITEEIKDANGIQPGPWGLAVQTPSGEINIKKKAQITLIKI